MVEIWGRNRYRPGMKGRRRRCVREGARENRHVCWRASTSAPARLLCGGYDARREASQPCWPSKLVDPLLSLERLSWFVGSTPQGGSAVEAGCMLDQRRAPHFSPRYPPSPDRADLKLTSRNAASSLTSSCLNAREIGQAWRSLTSEQTLRPAAALTPVPRLDRGSRSPGALTASPATT